MGLTERLSVIGAKPVTEGGPSTPSAPEEADAARERAFVAFGGVEGAEANAAAGKCVAVTQPTS